MFRGTKLRKGKDMKTCGTCGMRIVKNQDAVAVSRSSKPTAYFHSEYQDCQKALAAHDRDRIGIMVSGY